MSAQPSLDRSEIEIVVNKKRYRLLVDNSESLLDTLRDRLGIMSPKKGCEQGSCGACTVLLDGYPIYSCLMFSVEADGHEVLTVEGLVSGDELHPLQRAFIECDALQCGYCTPGMIMVAKHILDRKSDPTPAEVREALVGNICRCGAYANIVEAVIKAAELLRREGSS